MGIDLKMGTTIVAGGSGTSDSLGVVKFRFRNAGDSVYNTEVTSISAGDLVWDGITPPNSSDQ